MSRRSGVRAPTLVSSLLAAAQLLLVSGCLWLGTDRVVDRLAREYLDLAAALAAVDQESAALDSGSLQSGPVSNDLPPLVIVDRAAAAARSLTRESDETPVTAVRSEWLRAQLTAIAARAQRLAGAPLPFPEELRELFAIEALPVVDTEKLADVRRQIDDHLPGDGSPATRLAAFESQFTVPAPYLPAVFERALAECRSRTRERVSLPNDEKVTVRYVVGEPWSGFSDYQGHGRSIVSINTSYPLTVDRVLQLACHEGYPGHHTSSLLREMAARGGRPELAAVPLFSPQAFAEEAAAVHAVERVFGETDRVAFEQNVLFPLARLKGRDARQHVTVAVLVEGLRPAIGEALAHYLAGQSNFIETSWALQTNALMQHPQSTVAFADRYRGLALAYVGSADDGRTLTEQDVQPVGLASHSLLRPH